MEDNEEIIMGMICSPCVREYVLEGPTSVTQLQDFSGPLATGPHFYARDISLCGFKNCAQKGVMCRFKVD
jgi:hypothetical protein